MYVTRYSIAAIFETEKYEYSHKQNRFLEINPSSEKKTFTQAIFFKRPKSEANKGTSQNFFAPPYTIIIYIKHLEATKRKGFQISSATLGAITRTADGVETRKLQQKQREKISGSD